jgi:hypothetical protein
LYRYLESGFFFIEFSSSSSLDVMNSCHPDPQRAALITMAINIPKDHKIK